MMKSKAGSDNARISYDCLPGVRAQALITSSASLANSVEDAVRDSVSGGSLAANLQQQGDHLTWYQ